ncbi:MAG: PD-(D/E)XK nuclease family transposase, partial [Bacilli bacterium]
MQRPIDDVVFKYLFGYEHGKSALKHLCECFLDESFGEIVLHDTQVNMFSHADKRCRLDVFFTSVEENRSKKIDVESQMRRQAYFWERMVYYWVRSYAHDFKSGDDYATLKETVILIFYDGVFVENGDGIIDSRIRDSRYPDFVPTNLLRIVCVQLPLFHKKFSFDVNNTKHC